MNTLKTLAVLALAAFPLLVTADRDRDPADPYDSWRGENERGVFEYDDSQDKPWQESDAKLPALPPDDQLLPVQLDTLPPGLKAYIGAKSVSLDATDRVLRYWLVIRSPAGAYNASFEGMRCETQEYKVYAYGNPRQTPPTTPARKPVWKPVSPDWRSDYHAEMLRTLMCTEATRARSAADVLATLRGERSYRNPSGDNHDF